VGTDCKSALSGGKVLEGKQYLQIPESNKSFSQINEYETLAKEKGIQIIYLAE
jgi:hypothetical protein